MLDYPLLRLHKLGISAQVRDQTVPLVKEVSLEIYPKGSLAVVGQSGCGKTMMVKAVSGLLPNNCTISSGNIFFKKKIINNRTTIYPKGIRGTKIGVIFQHASSSLNPSMRIGAQMIEAPMHHFKMNRLEAKDLALHFLEKVKIGSPEKCFLQYPCELSGGMQQRVAIAIALSCKPELIIADEPTTALDSLSQFEVLKLLRELKEEYGLTLLLITHNLAIIPEICSSVAIMHQGSLIEQGSVKEVFRHPQKIYTRKLLEAVPKLPHHFKSRLKHLNSKSTFEEKELEFLLSEATLITRQIKFS